VLGPFKLHTNELFGGTPLAQEEATPAGGKVRMRARALNRCGRGPARRQAGTAAPAPQAPASPSKAELSAADEAQIRRQLGAMLARQAAG
jgi:hypothetical protein